MIDHLFVCTHNQGKLQEIEFLLKQLSIQIDSPRTIEGIPSPEENGKTLLANAQIKARAGFEATGLITLADDTGLIVPSLGGAPGIYSARYAGVDGDDRDQANRTKLVQALEQKSEQERAAYFSCVMVIQISEDENVSFEGRCDGLIIKDERGESGFGYDPIFFIPDLGKTFAELSSKQKNKISHRGLALQAVKKWLNEQV